MLQTLVSTIESKGAILGLLIIVCVAAALEFMGHLSYGMVSILQWAGGTYFGAQAAAHIGAGMSSPTPSQPQGKVTT